MGREGNVGKSLSIDIGNKKVVRWEKNSLSWDSRVEYDIRNTLLWITDL